MSKPRVWMVALSVILGWCATARASVFAAMDRDTLLVASVAVVEGRVLDVEGRWDDTGAVIYSDVTIEVLDTIVGVAPRTLRIRTVGGQVGDMRMEAVGFPAFGLREHVVVFVEEVQGENRVTGFRQGMFRVEQRADGPPVAVPTVDEDVLLVSATGDIVDAPAATDLEAFKADLRDAAAKLGRPASPGTTVEE